MMETIELNPIDRRFAAFISRVAGDAAPLTGVVSALVSNAVGEGNICLNLADIAGRRILLDGVETEFPGIEELRSVLEATRVVGLPGDFRPFVLDGEGRIYLYRYWKYEQDLALAILEKTAHVCSSIDVELLREGLSRLFPAESGAGPDPLITAAVAAVRKKFCIISGGPGTGKTSTLVKILALLIEQAKGSPLRIALAAPTGKSAARLKEAVGLTKENLNCAAEVKDRIAADVSTIHRLLGTIGGSTRFRYSADNPLPFDVVIVDEASMIALPLMARLVLSLKPDSRLILLGDRDQLASVEAGAVLGDICGGRGSEPFSPDFNAFIAGMTGAPLPAELPVGPLSGLADSLVILKKNYRFGADSGIGKLAAAVNAGESEAVVELLKGGGYSDIRLRGLPEPDGLMGEISDTVIDGYESCLAAEMPAEALKLLDRFRILCALRRGPYGVAGINAVIEEILASKGLIDPRDIWYHGRPVMITANDRNLKLFNGDVGIVFHDRGAAAGSRVWFPDTGGGVRDISPVQLPAHETVYAMTVHKSQGSEFDRVIMILPSRDSAILTRELIYTGITRARTTVEIWGREELLTGSISRTISRKSGLGDALWRGKANR
jgi:exodeoxyribonuclease V alpha subunit